MKAIYLVLLAVLSNVVIANKFYIDPVNGSNTGDGSVNLPWATIEDVITGNLIESYEYQTPYDTANPQLVIKNQGAPVKAGDTLLLFSGFHGKIYIENYINFDYINIIAANNQTPIISEIHLKSAKKWNIEGLTVSTEPYGYYPNDKLVFLESHNWFGPVSDIIISGCDIYSTATPWATSDDWVNKASDGIVVIADSVEVKNNFLTNIRFGISMQGDYIKSTGNTISNFSADGIRLLGSYNLIEKNTIKNCYDVDENHDDGIQAFTTGGIVVDYNIIRQNIILNYEDPNQDLLGPLQGIGCFDGPYSHWLIENNLIVVDHWHGISLYDADNCKIINNTVIDPTPDVSPGPSWIRIDYESNTSCDSCVVRNNAVNSLSLVADVVSSNNQILQSYSDYDSNFVDYANYDFHLISTSNLIDAGTFVDAPVVDIENTIRPQGEATDIGAYEYTGTNFVQNKNVNSSFKVYPNPANSYVVVLPGEYKNATIIVTNTNGEVLINKQSNFPVYINVSELSAGLYFLNVVDNNNVLYKSTFVKVDD
jgi:parallel beta-helix repeat protein